MQIKCPVQKLFFVFAIVLVLLINGCTYMGVRSIPLDDLKQKYASDTSEFIPVNGMNVHLRDEGNGPVLLLLHGVLASLHTWDGWIPELKKNYRVIRIDLPGFGLTGAENPGEFNIDLVKDTVIKILDSKKIERVTLIGNSFGGYLSWQLAVDYPERVERIVAIDAKSFPQKWPWLLKLVASFPTKYFAPHIAPRPTVSIGVHQVYGDNDLITSETIKRYHDLLMREGNRESMISIFKWVKSSDMPYSSPPDKKLLEIRQPLMTMWGKKDAWIPYEQVGKKWQAAYPDAVHKVYEDAGHIPMEEAPATTVKDLLDFLCKTNPDLGYECLL